MAFYGALVAISAEVCGPCAILTGVLATAGYALLLHDINRAATLLSMAAADAGSDGRVDIHPDDKTGQLTFLAYDSSGKLIRRSRRQ